MIIFPIIFILAVFPAYISIFFFLKTKLSKKASKRKGGLIMAILTLLGISCLYFLPLDFQILAKDYWSILLAGGIIILGGILDDYFDLNPGWQLLFQGVAAVIFLLAGDTIDHIRMFHGEIVYFSSWINYLLSFLWIIVVINAFNWLDGIDGLAGGIGLISMLTLFILSLTPIVNQPHTAAIALLVAGLLLGFLFFNFPPAKLYLGSVGSGFLGLMLALLSIYSGGKVATAALILGIPLLDFAWVIFQRIKKGKLPWRGKDRLHLHYQLLDLGMKKKQILLLFYLFCACFGALALSLQTGLKVISFGILSIFFVGIIIYIKKKGVKSLS